MLLKELPKVMCLYLCILFVMLELSLCKHLAYWPSVRMLESAIRGTRRLQVQRWKKLLTSSRFFLVSFLFISGSCQGNLINGSSCHQQQFLPVAVTESCLQLFQTLAQPALSCTHLHIPAPANQCLLFRGLVPDSQAPSYKFLSFNNSNHFLCSLRFRDSNCILQLLPFQYLRVLILSFWLPG